MGISLYNNKSFRRDFVSINALSLMFKKEVANWQNNNWYMIVAYNIGIEYDKNEVLYDRIAYNFDSKKNPREAVNYALDYAQVLEQRFGARAIVLESGFNGANVYVFLSEPLNWSIIKEVWEYLILHIPQNKNIIDKNINQWNRACRIPLTFNLKYGEKRKAKIIYPEELDNFTSFSWSIIKPLDAKKIRVENQNIARNTENY